MRDHEEGFDSPAGDHPTVNPADVDALLARELNSMSLLERERLYGELHGVHPCIDEREEFVEERLVDFEGQVQQLIAQGKAGVYELALRQSRTYVLDRKIRLMFLRAEYFDPRNAARRMVRFLECKKEFFGEAALVRPILLTDLDVSDMEVLKSGCFQMLPTRDTKGRPILGDFNTKGRTPFKKIENVIKSFLYIIYAIAEDEENQRLGLVALFYYSLGVKVAQDLHQRAPSLLDCVPLKMVGFHFCTEPNDPTMLVVKAIMMLVFGKKNRVKVRIHEGSHTEVQYSLMSFGLPVHSLPVTYEGELKTVTHSKWILRRQAKDVAYFDHCGLQATGAPDEFNFDGVDLPAQRDVLLGRGKTLQDHFGNQYLRTVAVVTYMDQYKNAAKNDKNGVAMEVVRATKKAGGRFLKRSNSGGELGSQNGWWKEVDDAEALDRVCKAFRSMIAALGRDYPAEEARRRFEDMSPGVNGRKRLKIEVHGPESVMSSNEGASSNCCF